MIQRIHSLAVATALIAVFSTGSYAGQKSTIGISGDVTTGTNGPNASGGASNGGSRYSAFYGSYPTIDFTSVGQRSTFETSYAFGFNRNFNASSDTTSSHSASSKFSSGLGQRWNISLSDSFEQTTNSSAFKLFRGDTSIPDSERFIFDPINAGPRRTYSGNIGMSHKISERSGLTFGGSYSQLAYLQESQFSGILSGQKRYSVNAGYNHALEHSSWSIGFSGSQFAFNSFQNSRSYSSDVGYTRELSKALSFHISGGPSYVDTQESIKHHVGVNASAGLQRAVKNGSFSIAYSQTTGDTSGLGSITDNRQASLGMSHTFSRRVSMSVDSSTFDTRGKTSTATTSRGVSAGGSVSFNVSRMLSMNWGVQYQHYAGISLFAGDQRRIFMNLRFHNPDFWRF